MQRLKLGAFASLTVGLGLVCSFLMLEVALRALDWPSPGLYQGGRGPLPLSLPDGNGSCWRAYSGEVRLRHWDYDVSVTLNEHGFIEAPRAPKAPGTWRVGVFGDSFAAGMGVEPEERFATRWWRSLRLQDPSVEVLNFGSAWSGTGQSAAFLAKQGAAYQLDEVVLALFGGNELGDNRTWKNSRALPAAERTRVEAKLRSGRLRDRIRNASRAAGFLYVTLSRGLARRESVVPTRSLVDRDWQTTREALDEFAAAVGKRSWRIWYLPSTVEWDDDAWASVSQQLALDSDSRHLVRDRVREWAQHSGVPFLDATAALAGRGGELRFPNDGHWNPDGHALVAQWLSERALPLAR